MLANVTLQRDLCFVEIIEGETDALARQVNESAFFADLGAAGIMLQSIDIGALDCSLVARAADAEALAAIARNYNLAVKVRGTCGCVAAHRDQRDTPLPPLASIIAVLHRKHIPIVHVVATPNDLTLVVNWDQVGPAFAVVRRLLANRAQAAVA